MAKRLLVAYWLWALGGPLGLHHVYLGRDSHALLWLVTLGGFGAGWLCDLPQLPTWVAAANGTRTWQRHRAGTAPAPSTLCFAAQLAAGIYLGTLMGLALPWAPAVPLGAALGVQLAASVGEQTVAAVPVLAAAGLAALLLGTHALPVSLAATVAAQHHQSYRDPAAPRAVLRVRLCRLALGYMALAATLMGAVLGRVGAMLLRLTQGTRGLVAAVLHWACDDGNSLDTHLRWAYEVGTRGLGGLIPGASGRLQRPRVPHGLVHASPRSLGILPIFLQVLGLSAGCSAEDVHRSYRELVKIWHPDHNLHRAKEAERRFIELQEAYEVLVGPRR
ncbi:DJC22 protein, partial [Nothocercus nigrocapillus]|nr:DJC22 protein [Nothocercus nigrocapillus]